MKQPSTERSRFGSTTQKEIRMQKIIRNFTLSVMLLLPAICFAAPKVTIQIKAEKEIVVKQKGKDVVKKVAVKSINPGEVITYKITYKNEGDELAKDAVINDPIPEGCFYLAETAEGKGADITYSIDKGKTYNKPTILTYEATGPGGKKELKVASPEEYTHIRWVIKSIPAGEAGSVSFKVKVR